jgi:cellulose synthase (UDP-forming)
VHSIDSAYEDGDPQVEVLKVILAAAFVVSGVVYLAWRTTAFNPYAPVVSTIFFIVEVLGFLGSLVVFFVAFRRRPRTPTPARPGLSVDVFVTTVDEDIGVVRRTLVAATRMTYPHTTWLLDDGDRPEFRELAFELGSRYLARRSRQGAKAGNINHALRYAEGAFMALLDADHCPQPNFLDRLLGYFDDPAVAFVQTPQDYYNMGSFQHAHGRSSPSIWHEQSNFHHVLQPGRDYHNATTLCGCSCVLRRSHLDTIGGFPEETVTEDMHAAVRLQKRGLKSVFHDEPLAFGIAPPDFGGFLRQRLRWGEGNMQVCRIERVPFTPKLTLRQNICYVLLAIAYADSWRKLIIYTAPPLTLLFQVPPVYGEPGDFVVFFLPYLLCGTLAYSEFFGGFGRIILTEIFDMARLSSGLVATWGLFRRHIRFRVSSKRLFGRSPETLALPQTLIGLLNVVAIVVALQRWLHIAHGVRPASTAIWIEGVLVTLCMIHIAFAVGVHRLVRRSARIDEDEFVHSVDLPLRLTGAGSRGRVVWTRALSVDYAWITDRLDARDHSGELLLPGGPVPVEIEIDGEQAGLQCLRLGWHSVGERDRLDQALHAGRWHRVLSGSTELGLTWLESLHLRRIPYGRSVEAARPFRPAILWRFDGSPALGYVRGAAESGEVEVIRFDEHALDTFALESEDGTRTSLAVLGVARTAMLDEGALEPLGARRLVARPAEVRAVDVEVDRERAPLSVAAGE